MKNILIISIALILVGAGCAGQQYDIPSVEQYEDASSSETQTSDNFAAQAQLQTFDGQSVGLSIIDGKVMIEGYEGKPLVVNSWAAWCPFCKKELPEFATIQKDFGDAVTYIAINRAESHGVAQKFLAERNILDDMVYLLDPKDGFYTLSGGIGMPITLFVNADGSIHFHKNGVMSEAEARERTQALLDANQ